MNERFIAQARDKKKKTQIGYDTATVLQELAESQISKLKDSNWQLNQSNRHANQEVQRCHDQIAR